MARARSSKKKRTAVRSSPNIATTAGLRAMGVDSGFAKGGISVVERYSDGQKAALHAECFETKSDMKKQKRKIRVSTNDQRRLDEIYERLVWVIDTFQPRAIGIEDYQVNPKQGGTARAAQVLRGVGMVQCLAKERNILLVPYLPLDLKKPLTGKAGASKLDVENWLRQNIHGAAKLLDQVAKSKREHAADAMGHAVLALDEMMEIRALSGLA